MRDESRRWDGMGLKRITYCGERRFNFVLKWAGNWVLADKDVMKLVLHMKDESGVFLALWNTLIFERQKKKKMLCYVSNCTTTVPFFSCWEALIDPSNRIHTQKQSVWEAFPMVACGRGSLWICPKHKTLNLPESLWLILQFIFVIQLHGVWAWT